jgi:hypothetical protein
MIRQLRLVLLLVAIAIIAASVLALLSYRADSQRRAHETHYGLRKTAEFLKPDTTSDLRFGKPKATPTPTAP